MTFWWYSRCSFREIANSFEKLSRLQKSYQNRQACGMLNIWVVYCFLHGGQRGDCNFHIRSVEVIKVFLVMRESQTKYSHYHAHERVSDQILVPSCSWKSPRPKAHITCLWKSLRPNTRTIMLMKESQTKYSHYHAHERVSDQILVLS